jgi:hypothetical protein
MSSTHEHKPISLPDNTQAPDLVRSVVRAETLLPTLVAALSPPVGGPVDPRNDSETA